MTLLDYNKLTHKFCPRCSLVKIRAKFRIRANGSSVSWCIECADAYTKEYRKRDGYKEQKTSYFRKSQYGLTKQDLELMLHEQNNSCKICGTEFAGSKFMVDHNHLTTDVRALLCRKCNVGLGMFNDDANLFHSALNYLNLYNGEGITPLHY